MFLYEYKTEIYIYELKSERKTIRKLFGMKNQ